MRDLEGFLESLSDGRPAHMREDLGNADLELKLRNTIALERIADALEQFLESGDQLS